MAAAQFDQNDLYPDTQKLKYTQAGLRLTGTFGSFDWGASYYYGHYKQPSADLSATILSGKTTMPSLEYDWKQTFGLEAATVLGRFNLRGELAYNLTDDVAGDNPWVHNNSIAWLAGLMWTFRLTTLTSTFRKLELTFSKATKLMMQKDFLTTV